MSWIDSFLADASVKASRGWGQSDASTHLLGVILGCFLFYAASACIYRVWFHPLSKFPGPPLLSAIYMPWLYKIHVQGAGAAEAGRLHQKYGPIVRVGPKHLIVDGSVAWPEIYARKSGDKAEFSKLRNFFPGGNGNIIGAPRDAHRRIRRQLAHAFSDAALREQEPLITGYVDLLLERLEELASLGQPVNIVSWFNFTTFDIIGDLVFADSFNSLKSKDYHPWVLSIFQGIRGFSFARFLGFYLPPALLPLAFKYNTAMKTQRQNRVYALEKTKARMALGSEPKDGRRDFMTYMLRKTRDGEEGMSESEILASSPLLLIAGSETTATALSGLWYHLGYNPSTQKRVTDEVRTAFASESEINMQTVSALEYLHACLEETLRIYPSVPEIPPRVSPGDTLNGDYVPAGTSITLYQRATFCNPAHFLEPDSFIPERWLKPGHPLYDERFQYDNKAVFKPFSHGPRDCLGKNLAYAEMRLVASRMIHRFDCELLSGQEGWNNQRSFLTWEKGPLNVLLRPRKVA